MSSARVKALSQKLVSAKLKLACNCVEYANLRWNARNVAKNDSKVEDDVSNALVAVSKEVTVAAKQNVEIIANELKDVLKRVPTQIKMQLKYAISHIHERRERASSEPL